MINRRRTPSSPKLQCDFDDPAEEAAYEPYIKAAAKEDRRGCQIDLRLRIQATRYFITLVALSIIAWAFSRAVQALHTKPYPTVLTAEGTDVCLKQLHSKEKIWIAMPAWDDEPGLHRALQSVIDQEETGYDSVRVVVFEDRSENMLSQDQKDHYKTLMDVTFMENNETVANLGSAYGKWKLFEYIRKQALPHEYTLVLDGDDMLADKLVLHDVHRALAKEKPWFAWGRHNGKYSEQCHDLNLKKGQTIRTAVWSFCHPRMFQTHLLQHVEARDFQRDDGTWLQKATDRPFIFQFMEMAGPERMAYLGDRPLYNYTMGSHNGLRIFEPSIIKGDKELVNHRPAATESPDTIHVVTCVYDRRNTQEFLENLMRSKLESGQTLQIHICNNNSDRRTELQQLVSRMLERWHLLHAHMHHKIEVYDMGGNHGGFSRFLLTRSIMQDRFVDYVIMIDDDQYVTSSTISEVYAKRKPQTFSTWYGKNWSPDEKSYWNPRESMIADPTQRYAQKTWVNSWQYGGTGMSIIDASVFLNKELFEIEKKYLFVEDVWLSYIVQVLGWNIRRLFVKFYDAGSEYRTSTGQWIHLKAIKEEFFHKVGYLACNMPRQVSVPKKLPLRGLDEPPEIAARS